MSIYLGSGKDVDGKLIWSLIVDSKPRLSKYVLKNTIVYNTESTKDTKEAYTYELPLEFLLGRELNE